MRSGFFAFAALSFLLVTGCAAPLAKSPSSTQAKTSPAVHPTKKVTGAQKTQAPPATRGQTSKSQPSSNTTSVSTNMQQQEKDLVKLHTKRNKLPSVSYPDLHVGSSGTDVVRLNELLASLGYMPLTWTPKQKTKLTPQLELINYEYPPKGTWKWRSKSVDSHLAHFWSTNHYSVITKGAVMSFEAAHGLKVDGIAGPKVWHALVTASLKNQRSPHGYTYVYVTKHRPENITIWHNGKVVETSLANTGIPQSPTANGTWPVYLRYRSQTMQGTNPNGTHYKDKGVPYVNYFHGGDAVHGFVRSSYGFPQSLGCVELPISKAKTAWKYISYGTLVTVAG